MTSMPKSFPLTAGALLASSVLAAGVLAGCGESEAPDQGSPAGAGEGAGITTTQPANGKPEKKTASGQTGKAGGKKHSGSNPASAGDKRGKAPDDAISDRPGGPKPPGAPQPAR